LADSTQLIELTTRRNPESRNTIRGRELIVGSSDMLRYVFKGTLGDGSREGFALQKNENLDPKITAMFTGTQLRDLRTWK
jgi:hypothetical protein